MKDIHKDLQRNGAGVPLAEIVEHHGKETDRNRASGDARLATEELCNSGQETSVSFRTNL